MRHNRRDNAFTLVEFMVAMALAALIAVAVLGLVTSASRMLASFKAPQDGFVPSAELKVLQFDLANAESIVQDAESVRLQGHAGLDGLSPHPSHRPVEVVYIVQNTPAGGVLLRRQFDRLRPSNQPERVDVVAFGVQSVRIGELSNPRHSSIAPIGTPSLIPPSHGIWELVAESRENQK